MKETVKDDLILYLENFEELQNFLGKKHDMVVIMFSSDYCPDCSIYERIIKKLAKTLPGARFLEVNVSRDPTKFVGKYKIRTVPLFVIYNKGELFHRVGKLKRFTFENMINQFYQWLYKDNN